LRLLRRKPLLVCHRRDFKLELWMPTSDGYYLDRTYPIAVGMQGYRTDPGAYKINGRSDAPEWRRPASPWVPRELWGTVVPAGVPENPIRERFLGWGRAGEGIHGTLAEDSIGTRASHGCIRMKPDDVIELYPLVPKRTPIVIY
jgi:lipoprotein-anchoring transpeptidase ErfK/SrfK